MPRLILFSREQVESKARCLEKERNNSLHHEDLYWETGFELSRYTFFSKYICSIENGRLSFLLVSRKANNLVGRELVTRLIKTVFSEENHVPKP